MTIDEKKKIIIGKINSGSLNYTNEEKIIIMYSSELLYPFLKLVNSSNDFLFDDFFKDYMEVIVQNVVSETSDINLKFEAVYCLIKSYYRTGIDSEESAESILEPFGLKNDIFVERIEKLKEDETKNLKNTFYKQKTTKPFLINLLNAKRYDLLENIYIDYDEVSYEVLSRIEKECPNVSHRIFLNIRDLEKHVNDFSTDDTFQFLLSAFDYYVNKTELTKEDNDSIDMIRTILEKKIESSSDLSMLNNGIGMELFDSFKPVQIFSLSDIDLIQKLYDRNYIENSFILVNRGILHRDEVINKIDNNIDQNIKFTPYLFDRLDINVFENEKYLDYLVSQGEIGYLLEKEKKENIKGALERKIPDIIKKIVDDNPNYEYISGRINDNFTAYPELCEAILKKGKIDSIWLDEIIDNKDFLDIVVNLSKTKTLKIKKGLDEDRSRDFAFELADNGCYSTLFESSGLVEYLFSDRDYLLEKMDDYYFSYMLIEKKFMPLFIDDKRIMNKLLVNPILVDKALELIAHDEKFKEEYCNNETFELVVDHLVEKYGLNKNHLERLEKLFGDEVILYVENDTIQEIISLDEENFSKFLALFPKVQYTMNDIEASYESIIQYSFGKENVEDISIFPALIHSIEDGNTDTIKKLRRKIVTNISEDFLAKIIEKHGLYEIENTGDLIDLIISKNKSDEREKYIDILHEVTNEYISNCRTNYRNNHLFDEKHPEYSNLMDKILDALDNNDEASIELLLSNIAQSLDSRFYSDYDKDGRLPDALKDPEVLMLYVIAKVKDKDSCDNYLPVLRRIVDYYHDKNRDLSSKELVLGEELKLGYKLDEKSKKNVLNKYFIINCTSYIDKYGNLLSDKIIQALKIEGFDDDLIFDCLKYYCGPKDYVENPSLYESRGLSNSEEQIQRNMSRFVQIANKVVNETEVYNIDGTLVDIDSLISSKKHDKFLQIKRTYEVEKTRQHPYQLLSNLNIKLICDNILSDEETFNSLLDVMKKKKLHMFPDYFSSMLEKCGISGDVSNIASFISFFPSILESERKRLASIGKNPKTAFSGVSSALLYADTYSSVSSVYSQILGDNDAKLIRANANPNEARFKTKNNERLNEAISYTANNYRRNEITVPSFDEVVTIGNESNPKQMNVIVGNFTDGCNLTHGERTGACMRIGGEGETLFKFCLTNKNGFHIRFEDPETHEYISRVSGFRNGNTVFLNELRLSCNEEKYSNEDVIKSCIEAAKLLVEKSKDSTCPIENVVIANQYAMKLSNMEVIPFGVSNIKSGLPSFYSDIDNSGIVLATTAKDDYLTPINFDKSKVPVYEPCRGKVKMSSDSNELFAKINRVASIKTLLSGVPFDQIDKMEFPEGLLCGVYSDDWYIYVDNNKEIHYDFIDIDKRAEKEVFEYLELVDSLIEKTEKDNEMKGEINYGAR